MARDPKYRCETGARAGFDIVYAYGSHAYGLMQFLSSRGRERLGRRRPREADVNEWTIRGEPDLYLRNDRVPTRLITCTSVVNRIPDVINADPERVPG